MGDFVYSVYTEDEAINTAAQGIHLMKACQFNLVKWNSNSQAVLYSIPPPHRLSLIKQFDGNEAQRVCIGHRYLIHLDFKLVLCRQFVPRDFLRLFYSQSF